MFSVFEAYPSRSCPLTDAPLTDFAKQYRPAPSLARGGRSGLAPASACPGRSPPQIASCGLGLLLPETNSEDCPASIHGDGKGADWAGPVRVAVADGGGGPGAARERRRGMGAGVWGGGRIRVGVGPIYILKRQV